MAQCDSMGDPLSLSIKTSRQNKNVKPGQPCQLPHQAGRTLSPNTKRSRECENGKIPSLVWLLPQVVPARRQTGSLPLFGRMRWENSTRGQCLAVLPSKNKRLVFLAASGDNSAVLSSRHWPFCPDVCTTSTRGGTGGIEISPVT